MTLAQWNENTTFKVDMCCFPLSRVCLLCEQILWIFYSFTVFRECVLMEVVYTHFMSSFSKAFKCWSRKSFPWQTKKSFVSMRCSQMFYSRLNDVFVFILTMDRFARLKRKKIDFGSNVNAFAIVLREWRGTLSLTKSLCNSKSVSFLPFPSIRSLTFASLKNMKHSIVNNYIIRQQKMRKKKVVWLQWNFLFLPFHFVLSF